MISALPRGYGPGFQQRCIMAAEAMGRLHGTHEHLTAGVHHAERQECKVHCAVCTCVDCEVSWLGGVVPGGVLHPIEYSGRVSGEFPNGV